jgi:hypothetical protein
MALFLTRPAGFDPGATRVTHDRPYYRQGTMMMSSGARREKGSKDVNFHIVWAKGFFSSTN